MGLLGWIMVGGSTGWAEMREAGVWWLPRNVSHFGHEIDFMIYVILWLTGITGILVFSASDSPHVTRETFRCGVDGYVMKAESPEALKKALRTVADGESYINPQLAVALTRLQQEEDLTGLTDREKQILQLIAFGYTNSDKHT
ncbi:MAG: DNA-binding response regulator [Bacteroidetes bacterium]|nr:DNA-binding response regulator [Bacteroidota bacterium]